MGYSELGFVGKAAGEHLSSVSRLEMPLPGDQAGRGLT